MAEPELGTWTQDESRLPAPAPNLPWALARRLDLDQQRAAGPKERRLASAWERLAGRPGMEICPIVPAWGDTPFPPSATYSAGPPQLYRNKNRFRVAK